MRPLFQMGKLDPEDRGLKRIQAKITANSLMIVFSFGSMNSKNPQLLQKFRASSCDSSSIAKSSEVLGREEREAPHGSDATGPVSTTVLRSDALRGILNQMNVCALHDLLQPFEIGHLTKKMNGNYGSGSRSDSVPHILGVQIVGVRVNIGKNRSCAKAMNDSCSSEEGEWV